MPGYSETGGKPERPKERVIMAYTITLTEEWLQALPNEGLMREVGEIRVGLDHRRLRIHPSIRTQRIHGTQSGA
jgi:hypothetical protein